MRTIGGKAKGQRGRIKKNNGFVMLQLSYFDNARRPLSVISRLSVLCRRIVALIWQIYIKSLDAY